MTAISTKEDVLNAVANMSVIDVVELIKMMEDKFDVSAAAPAMAMPMMAAGGAQAAPAEEKTEFSIVITKVGDKKVEVIKAIRAMTSLGLKEAKDMSEANPPIVVKEGVSKADADSFKKQLEEAGASVEVK